MEGIARPPNAAGDIRGAMVLAAGLIDGVGVELQKVLTVAQNRK